MPSWPHGTFPETSTNTNSYDPVLDYLTHINDVFQLMKLNYLRKLNNIIGLGGEIGANAVLNYLSIPSQQILGHVAFQVVAMGIK